MDNFRKQLWARLEACGIPIQTAQIKLVQEFGQRELVWSSTQSVCEITSKPFIQHLAVPLSFQFTTGADLNVLAKEYSCYVRQSDDTDVNFRVAVDQLTELFGPGTDCSVSNTRSQRWQHNRTSLTATVFPADQNNFGTNDRHQLVAGSATECSIHIDTGYLVPIDEFELAILGLFEPMQSPAGSTIHFFQHTRTNRFLEAPQPVLEQGFDTSMTYFFQLDNDRANVVPVSWISAIHRDTLTPARGSGGEYLGFEIKWSNGSKFKTSILRHQRPHGLRELATNLSKRLNVPLVEHEEPDC